MVGAEDALQLACTDDDGGDGDGTYGVMDYFVYRRTGVLADRSSERPSGRVPRKRARAVLICGSVSSDA